MIDDQNSYHARFLDPPDTPKPEDAAFDPGLKETLTKLYERQVEESLRVYNNTARPEGDIEQDMHDLDIAHEQERARYIRDYAAAKELRAQLQDKAPAFDNEQKFTR